MSPCTPALQKAAQNPVASMISVPIQNNSNFGLGPYDRIQNVLNVQPVFPFRISENWNLIVRWIAPIVWQPAPGTANLEVYGIVANTPECLVAQEVQKQAGVFGFGDMSPTFFFAPAKPHKVIWGAGLRPLSRWRTILPDQVFTGCTGPPHFSS
ncbi:MAG TPA: hypothetical protein VH437_20520 [Terriglobales bacterium]